MTSSVAPLSSSWLPVQTVMHSDPPGSPGLGARAGGGLVTPVPPAFPVPQALVLLPRPLSFKNMIASPTYPRPPPPATFYPLESWGPLGQENN